MVWSFQRVSISYDSIYLFTGWHETDAQWVHNIYFQHFFLLYGILIRGRLTMKYEKFETCLPKTAVKLDISWVWRQSEHSQNNEQATQWAAQQTLWEGKSTSYFFDRDQRTTANAKTYRSKGCFFMYLVEDIQVNASGRVQEERGNQKQEKTVKGKSKWVCKLDDV